MTGCLLQIVFVLGSVSLEARLSLGRTKVTLRFVNVSKTPSKLIVLACSLHQAFVRPQGDERTAHNVAIFNTLWKNYSIIAQRRVGLGHVRVGKMKWTATVMCPGAEEPRDSRDGNS
jgi:hypothetical protein